MIYQVDKDEIKDLKFEIKDLMKSDPANPEIEE